MRAQLVAELPLRAPVQIIVRESDVLDHSGTPVYKAPR